MAAGWRCAADGATAERLPLSAKVPTRYTSFGGSAQQTGPGKVLGPAAGYARAFTREFRILDGTGSGPLLAQQTAANLHAEPGDIVGTGKPGGGQATVRWTASSTCGRPARCSRTPAPRSAPSRRHRPTMYPWRSGGSGSWSSAQG